MLCFIHFFLKTTTGSCILKKKIQMCICSKKGESVQKKVQFIGCTSEEEIAALTHTHFLIVEQSDYDR